MSFGVAKKAMGIRPLRNGAPRGHQVNLSSVVAWVAREARLHQPDSDTLEANLKLEVDHFLVSAYFIKDSFIFYWIQSSAGNLRN